MRGLVLALGLLIISGFALTVVAQVSNPFATCSALDRVEGISCEIRPRLEGRSGSRMVMVFTAETASVAEAHAENQAAAITEFCAAEPMFEDKKAAKVVTQVLDSGHKTEKACSAYAN